MKNSIKVLDKRTADNQSLTHGDFVTCVNCGAIMLVDIGIAICPECNEESLTWTDSKAEEVDKEYFADNEKYSLTDK